MTPILDGSQGGELVLGPHPDNISLALTERTIVVSEESSTDSIEGDANINTITTGSTENEFAVTVPLESTGPTDTLRIQSTANGSVNGNVVSRVADGEAVISIDFGGVRKGKTVSFLRAATTTYKAFDSWVEGTFAEHCSQQIDSRISSGSISQYAIRNTAAGVYQRNPAAWAADVDLTAIPPNCPGIIITPLHLLVSTHYPGSGAVHFVANDNTTIVRTRASIETVPGITDLSVVTLNAEVPDSITPVKFPPANLVDYLPSPQYGVACFASNQFRDCLVKDSYRWDIAGADPEFPFVVCQEPTHEDRIALTKQIIPGDSGSPVCLIVDGALVLLSLWSAGGWGSGPRAWDAIDAINEIVSGYSLNEIDLSSFPNYGD